MTKGKYLCVYCGASERVDPFYYQSAEELGKLIATNGFNMVYGGGRLGLMGRVSNAVVENEIYVVDTMHTRKLQMSQKADAFIIMPGGFGTLDEFFEILTWKQLNLHHKPIIIANLNNFWDPLVSLFHHIIDADFARKEHAQFLHVENSLENVIKTAKRLLK